MPHATDTKEQVYRLSSIDQSLCRTYIRWAACFSCEANLVDTAAANLHDSVKCAVSHLPILAGSVRPADTEDQGLGRVEVAVTLNKVSNFVPTIKHLSQVDFRYTFE